MAFPTDTNYAQPAVASLLSLGRLLRSEAAKYVIQCDGGALSLNDVAVGFLNYLSDSKIRLVILATVDGLYTELASQKPNHFIDATAAQAAFNDIVLAIDNMILFLEANVPYDGSRRILSLILSNDGSGTTIQRTITNQTQLDAFHAELAAFRDAFEG